MMMNYAYDELYIPLTQRMMGDMYDYAVNTLNIDLVDFHDMLLVSGMAHQIEIGNPTYIAGKNGCEVARIVIAKGSDLIVDHEDVMYIDKTREYWIGWALAYYQWYTSISFKEINKRVSITDISNMYDTLHEADISVFIRVMDEKINPITDLSESTLKRLRAYANLSQSALSKKSGVALRQIQLFEQGKRDIKKTQASTLMKLAVALNCDMNDLLN